MESLKKISLNFTFYNYVQHYTRSSIVCQ